MWKIRLPWECPNIFTTNLEILNQIKFFVAMNAACIPSCSALNFPSCFLRRDSFMVMCELRFAPFFLLGFQSTGDGYKSFFIFIFFLSAKEKPVYLSRSLLFPPALSSVG